MMNIQIVIIILLILSFVFCYLFFSRKDFIIVSLTTSPRRIKLMKPVIDSILNQTYPPDLIRINIPKIFGRSGEKFDKIPNFLLNNPKIEIVEYDHDYGPIMKFLPTFYDYKDKDNINIIYTDDDVLMLPKTIEVFMRNVKSDTNKIYCFSGFKFNFTSKEFDWNWDIKNFGNVDVVEGYMSVCLSKDVLKKLNQGIELKDYHSFVSQNKYCFTSDDLLLSNYYTMKNIEKVKIFDVNVNMNKWWSSGCELSYGKDGDGIQHLYPNQHFLSYKNALKFLNEHKLMFFI